MDFWADVYLIVGTVEAMQTQLLQIETMLLEFLGYTTTQVQVTVSSRAPSTLGGKKKEHFYNLPGVWP